MEIADFKNFEQFLVYTKQHAEEMQHWSMEQHQKFSEKVWKLREENPEFRQKYDNWVKRLEASSKKKQAIVIGGTGDEQAYSQAKFKLLKLRENLNKDKIQNSAESETDKKDKKSQNTPSDIVILNKKKKQYTI